MSNKLELTWVGKEKEYNIEPRILIEDKEKSYSRSSNTLLESKGINDNILIHGDNLLALKALEPKFTGKIKCIYIDPPYNTGSAFEHYDDNLEHSTWLSLMKPRLELLRKLLSDDGSIWISIDDDERDYLKILCDEVFGRFNFVTAVIWQKKATRANDAKWFSDNHDYILIYAINKMKWHPNLLSRNVDSNSNYSNPDNDSRGPWQSLPLQAKSGSDSNFKHTFPNGISWQPPKGRFSAFSHETLNLMYYDNRIWFGKDGKNVPRYKKFRSEVKEGFVPLTIWNREEVGDNQEAKKEVKNVDAVNVFSTPKPERLIQRILTIATNPGDLVLDSFLGSGTTAAVAHKMGRRWIGIEMGEQAYTHCKVRLDKVINNEDQGGITKTVNWQGGGGYKFYELAPTLIKTDDFGQEIINPVYNNEMLAAAVAIHEGYNYNPDPNCYFKQANNGFKSYLFVTTNHVNHILIENIKLSLKEDEYLLIVCKSYDQNANDSKNIIIKKIPQSLLKKCEFDVDNYNLNIINPPIYEDEEDEE